MTTPQRSALLSWVPDSVAIVAVSALAIAGTIHGETAVAAILAVLSGRLYPRHVGGSSTQGPQPPASGGGPGIPSGLATLTIGLIGAAGSALARPLHVARSYLVHPPAIRRHHPTT